MEPQKLEELRKILPGASTGARPHHTLIPDSGLENCGGYVLEFKSPVCGICYRDLGTMADSPVSECF